jgi:hypothetical protein
VSARTGLAAEVPTLDLCREMAAIPALAEAFKDSVWCWCENMIKGQLCQREILSGPILKDLDRSLGLVRHSAPTVRELLAWLTKECRDKMGRTRIICASGIPEAFCYIWPCDGIDQRYDITDPDALARACIEAAR